MPTKLVKLDQDASDQHGKTSQIHHNELMTKISEDVPKTTQKSGSKPIDSVAPKPATSAGGNRKSGWWIYIISSLMIIGGVLIIAASNGAFHRGPTGDTSATARPIPAAYSGSRAGGYLKQLCDLGPRPSGSLGMQRQQELLQQFFTNQGATVTFQTFQIRHPENGSDIRMANLIASWHPNRPKRYLICAHYDTRPYPDQDRRNRRGRFIGANDGASGTAGLMELAHQMKDLPADVGVDLVAFDGEEFVFQQGRDKYFLGSTFFAEKYKLAPPTQPYQAGVLLDMIGDRELKIYYEMNSLRFARPVATDIWRTARRLGVRAFVPKSRHDIQDDHLPLNNIARIPTVDIIDFDYPRPGIGAPSYWHTEQDIPENCSGDSIAAVVWVVHEWLKTQ